MSQALYRKWRPAQWDEVVGQEHIIRTLQNALRTQRVAHAYLFAGPRGTGKTTTARLLAKGVNCLADDLASHPCNQCENCLAVNQSSFLDLIEIDAASNTSVDDVRDLRDKIHFSPSKGRFKVYIIDEVHMLSMAAFNALLKTLEEPPPHAIFILATTEVHKIPPTVLSRCQRHEFRRIPVQDIVHLLEKIAKNENIQVEQEALTLIARQSTGSFRDAISLLDQLASIGENITLEMAHNILGTATNQAVVALVNAILQSHPEEGLLQIHKALDAGSDPRQFARQIVEYLRGLLLTQMGNPEQVDATAEMKQVIAKQAAQFSRASLLETIRTFNAAASETRTSWQPGLLLELSLADSIKAGQQTPPAFTHLQEKETVPRGSEVPAAISIPPDVGKKIPKTEEKTHAAPIKTTAPVAQKEKKEPATGTDFNLDEVLAQWNNVRALVKRKRPSTEALLNSCKPVQVKDGFLWLGFQSEMVKSKMEIDENIQLACQALSEATGKTIKIRCTVIKGKTTTDLSTTNIEGDGMVSTALNLGGQIVQKE